MTTLRFDISFSDGSQQSLQTDTERVLIGRGAHCEIRLPMADAAHEHVVVEVVGATLRVVARAFTPPPLLNGDPVTEVLVTEDAVLRIGAVQIRISRLDSSTATAPKKPTGGSLGVRVVGVLALAVLAWMFWLRATRGTNHAPTSVPELWSGAGTPCPVSVSARAQALAVEKRILADGKRERHPFSAADGVEAVTLYQTAAACFVVAGDAESASELTSVASRLRADVNDDFRVRRLRLDRALASRNDEVAAHEVVMLRTLTLNQQGPYIDWLNALARKLEVDKDVP